MSVTKIAFARGVGNYLQRTGTTRIPTEALLKQACAVAANALQTEPALNAVPHVETFKVAQHLVAFSASLVQNGKIASNAQPAVIDRDAQTAYGDLVHEMVKQSMAKQAEAYPNNPANTSSLITGGASPANTIGNSYDASTVLESHRPDGYALVGQGNANIDGSVPSHAVTGNEQVHPLAPTGVAGAGSNSVVDATKNAQIADTLRKLAMGTYPHNPASEPTTITGTNPSQGNTQNLSPSAEGKLDIAQRPEPYALVNQGNANIDDTPSQAVTGQETPHGDQPAHTGAASNSVVDASKNAQWRAHFDAVATLVGPQLPAAMPMEQKVASVKHCMSLEPIAQTQYLQKVAAQYAPQNTVNSLLGSLSQLH